jgi:hypothetical protein
LDERNVFKLELAKALLKLLSPDEVKQAFQTEQEFVVNPKESVLPQLSETNELARLDQPSQV